MAIDAIELTLDLNPTYYKKESVWCSQLDNVLRTLSITLTDGGEAYDVGASGYDVYIEGTKPDKRGFSYKVTDISGTISGSTILIPLQTQMTAVKGLVETEIVLKSGDDRIGSANFWLMVEKAGLADDVDTSTSELAPYLNGAQQAAEIATEAAETAERVLNSIPSDYSELSDTVSDLSDRVDNFNVYPYVSENYRTHEKLEVGVSVLKDGQNTDIPIWGTNSTIPEATTSKNGWMSAQDKTKLEGISFITSAEITEVLEG